MARVNNLSNFLNDVAVAIKEKLGDSTNIPAAQFDTKIREIETVGDYQSKTINISANGSRTITPDSEYDALSSVVINVQVPVKQLQSKGYEFTENTHIVLSPETGYDGFSSIELTINVPTIDTSDATATANDIVENKTAYVNGQKITGTIIERRNTQYLIPTGRDTTIQNSPRARRVIATSKVVDNGDSYVIDSTNKAQIEMPYADVASAISLTAEKIVSGNTILGIEGTGGGTTAHDAVKLFTSSSDMNNDNDKVLGDIAIVYNNSTLTGLYVVTSVNDTLTYTPLPTQLSAITSGDVYLNKVVMGANNNIVTGTIPVNASEVDTAEATTESILGPEVEPSAGNQDDSGEGDLKD